MIHTKPFYTLGCDLCGAYLPSEHENWPEWQSTIGNAREIAGASDWNIIPTKGKTLDVCHNCESKTWCKNCGDELTGPWVRGHHNHGHEYIFQVCLECKTRNEHNITKGVK